MTYANVVSTLALLLAAGGGGAYAAAQLTGADIKDGTITGADVKGAHKPFVDGSLTTWDVKDGSLRSRDVANGAITPAKLSSRSHATTVIDGHGPLPISGTFTSRGGKLLVIASGSAYHKDSAPHRIRVGIEVSGGPPGTIGFDDDMSVFANQAYSHEAFVTYAQPLPLPGFKLPAGRYTIRLYPADEGDDCPANAATAPCTVTDENDEFRATVIEFP